VAPAKYAGDLSLAFSYNGLKSVEIPPCVNFIDVAIASVKVSTD
jgi:hypothetical protein